MASASGSSTGAAEHTAQSGAAEHTVGYVWRGALAYCNIGLTGETLTGNDWNLFRNLLDLFRNLLEKPVLGLLLGEVGNLGDLMTGEGRKRLEDVLAAAFEEAGATKHGPPQFFWSDGEAMAAFRSEVQIRRLEPLTNMEGVNARRVVERFELIGATKDGPCSLLVYNSHQLSSKQLPFRITQQSYFCKSILEDAIRFCGETERCVGYGFGGDTNCSMSHWALAVAATPKHRLSFNQPSFMFGPNKRGGDMMLGAGRAGLAGIACLRFSSSTCALLEGSQHNPMIMEWCYIARMSEVDRNAGLKVPPGMPTGMLQLRDERLKWSAEQSAIVGSG